MCASTTPTTPGIDFQPMDASDAPEEGFIPLSGYELVPEDISTTPPATAELHMSEEFTNEKGADVKEGKARDYVLVLKYPAGVDNTVILMPDCPTIYGTRLFRGFLDDTCEKKGYSMERIDIEDLMEADQPAVEEVAE